MRKRRKLIALFIAFVMVMGTGQASFAGEPGLVPVISSEQSDSGDEITVDQEDEGEAVADPDEETVGGEEKAATDPEITENEEGEASETQETGLEDGEASETEQTDELKVKEDLQENEPEVVAKGENPEIVQDENLYVQTEFKASARHFVYYETVVGTGSYMDSVSSLDESYRVKDAEVTGVTNEWFALAGWNTEPDGSGTSYKPGEKVSLTDNLVLYAQWEFAGVANPVLAARYNARAVYASVSYTNSYDGASATDNGREVGSTYSVKSPAALGFTYPGQYFKYWSTDPYDVSGTRYNPGDEIQISGNLLLHAIWTSDPTIVYGVIYVDQLGNYRDMGSVSPNTDIVLKSSEELGFTNPGFYFDGWYLTDDYTGSVYSPGDSLTITGNTMLYAKWSLQPSKTYGLTFFSFEGGGIHMWGKVVQGLPLYSTYTFVSPLDMGMPNPPVDRAFDHWNTAEDGSGDKYYAGNNVTINDLISGMRLYAQWSYSGNRYTVNYDANGGTGFFTDGNWRADMPYTVKDTTETGVSRDNYTFTSWNTAADGSGTSYAPAQVITLTGDMTLYAQWEYTGPLYTVYYNANGGSGSHTDSNWQVDVPYTVKDVSATGISRTNYTFTSWNTAADGSGTSYAPAQVMTLTGDVTLYAQWTYSGSLYAVAYEANGGIGAYADTGLQADVSYIVKDAAATGVSRTHYSFVSWNTAADGSGTEYLPGDSINLTGDVTLYAQWEYAGPLYAVHYDANGGTGAYGDIDVQMDIPYIVKDVLTTGISRTNYTFVSWNTAADGSGTEYLPGESINLTGDVTLYAQWTYSGSLYTVRYEANGGTGSYTDSNLQADIPYMIKDTAATGISRANYTFVSWNTAANGSGVEHWPGENIDLTGDITLYAQWTYSGELRTVAYVANGGTGSYVDTGLQEDLPYTIKDSLVTGISKTDYSFVSWNTAADGSGTEYLPGDVLTGVNSNLVLYAQWKYEGPLYIVNYEANGGTGSYTDSNLQADIRYIISNVAATGISRANYSFTSWNTAADGSGTEYLPGEEISLTGDMTLYAQWTYSGERYLVNYIANGGTGSYMDSGLQADLPYTVKDGAATGIARTNYTISSWNTKPDGSGTVYYAGDSITLTGNLVLYAQWTYTGSLFTVNYNANGGTGSYADANLQVNMPYIVKNVVLTGISKANYSFASWNTEADGSGVTYYPGNVMNLNSDVTLYAQWIYTGPRYSVIYIANGGAGMYMDSNLQADTAYPVKDIGATGISRTNYGFIKWNTAFDGSGTSYASGDIINLSGNVVLYAQWTYAGALYSVKYNANGGTGSYTDGNLMEGINYAVKSSVAVGISRTNYSLASWNTQADGSGTQYFSGDVFGLLGDITLYAQWTYSGPRYSVIYVANGGTGMFIEGNLQVDTPYIVKDGPATGISRTDWELNGWNTMPDLSGTAYAPGDSINLTGNIILYGDWTYVGAQYTISYDANGGTGSYGDSGLMPGALYAVKGAAATGISKVNYSLASWNTQADGSGLSYQPGDAFAVTADITLYAQWNYAGPRHNVIYIANGGTGFFIDSNLQVDIPYLVKDEAATGIFRTDYTLLSWNTAVDGSGTAYAPGDSIDLTGPVILYAQWEYSGARYTVTYEANGGTGSYADMGMQANLLYLVKGTAATGISRTHYTFVSWNTAADGSGTSYGPGASITLTNNVTLYARWTYTGPRYMVTYSANGGTGAFVDSNLQADLPYLVKDTTATGIDRTNYTFVSWNTAADGSGTAYAPGGSLTLTGNIILYAQWEYSGPLYEVTYSANGGTGSYADSGLQADIPYIVKDAGATGISKINYTLKSWNTAADGSGTSYLPGNAMNLTGDVTLYAQWNYSGPRYTVSYNATSGTGSYEEGNLQADIPYIVKNIGSTGISNADFKFLSWNTSRDGSGISYLPGDSIMLTGDITLYAQWIYTGAQRFKVTYEAGRGTGFHEDISLLPGTSYTVKDPSTINVHYPGFKFKSWNTDVNGAGTEYLPGDVIDFLSDNIKLYAQWEYDASTLFTVTYKPGIGQGGHIDTSLQGGSSYKIKNAGEAQVTMDFFKLVSWNTNPDGTGDSYAPDEIITLNGNLILYAQWEFSPF